MDFVAHDAMQVAAVQVSFAFHVTNNGLYTVSTMLLLMGFAASLFSTGDVNLTEMRLITALVVALAKNRFFGGCSLKITFLPVSQL